MNVWRSGRTAQALAWDALRASLPPPIPLVEAPGPCTQGHGVPGRAHLQGNIPFVDFVAVCDRGGGKRTGGEHSRAARRELRREPLRRGRNEGRGIRDGGSEQDGTRHENVPMYHARRSWRIVAPMKATFRF